MRGSAEKAGPLLYFVTAIAFLAGVGALIGCASSPPPTPTDGPTETAFKDSSWTGYPLLIAPVVDQTAARDVPKGYMADFR